MAETKKTQPRKTTRKAPVAAKKAVENKSQAPAQTATKTKVSKLPKGIYIGIGRRKRAIARVRLTSGEGDSYINGKKLGEYVKADMLVKDVLSPFTATGSLHDFSFEAKVKGGGSNAQLSAIKHGISRALSLVNDEIKKTLAMEGYLTRDPREKERKKYFLVRARKRPQFSKR